MPDQLDQTEQFSWKKFFLSFTTGLYWTKTVAFCIGAAILIFSGLFIWNLFFRKSDPSQVVRAGRGSTVTVYQQNDRRKTLIPFVEGYVGENSNEKANTGIRGGVRFEW